MRSTSPTWNFANRSAVTALIARPDTTISALDSAHMSFGFNLLASVRALLTTSVASTGACFPPRLLPPVSGLSPTFFRRRLETLFLRPGPGELTNSLCWWLRPFVGRFFFRCVVGTFSVALLGTPFLRPGPGALTKCPNPFRPLAARFFLPCVVDIWRILVSAADED